MPTQKQKVEEFGGQLIAGPGSNDQLLTRDGKIWEYQASFPSDEDFDDYLKTFEDEIADYVIHFEDGVLYVFFRCMTE